MFVRRHNKRQADVVAAILLVAISACPAPVAAGGQPVAPTSGISERKVQSSQNGVYVEITRIRKADDNGTPGYDVQFTYKSKASSLYIDGIGDVPGSGTLTTVTGDRTLVFRPSADAPPVAALELPHIRAQYEKLAARPASDDTAQVDDLSRARVQLTLGNNTTAAKLSQRALTSGQTKTLDARASALLTYGAAETSLGDQNRALYALDRAATIVGRAGPEAKRELSGKTEQSFASNAIVLSDAFAGRGDSYRSTAALTAVRGLHNPLAQQADDVSATLGALVYAPDPLLGDQVAGPPAAREEKFETADYIPWGRNADKLHDRIRGILKLYFKTTERQDPCPRTAGLNCKVSLPLGFGPNYKGWDARVVFRIMAFVPHEGTNTVQLQYAVRQRKHNPDPGDIWVPADDTTNTAEATAMIKKGARDIVERLDEKLRLVART